jgi:carboxypeptidase Taq
LKAEALKNPSSKAERLRFLMQEIADLQSASSVLQWDLETYIPSGASSYRSRQIATLAGLSHEKFTSGEISVLVDSLLQENHADQLYHRSLLRIKKDLSRKEKLNREFVEQLSHATSEGLTSWEKARKQNEFKVFAPSLKNLIALKKNECEFIGYKSHPYDALVDEFEPGMTKALLDSIFNKLLPHLNDLFKKIKGTNSAPDYKFLFGHFDSKTQWEMGLKLLKQIGFDFNRGRQDLSIHPFTITTSPDDVRITTRISEENFSEMLWSCLHEAGHAIYEQGLSKGMYGFPSSEAASLGIHESQSRLWENQIGRELPFWIGNYSILKDAFPLQFEKIDLNDFYKGINIVEPGLIRTNADELTYHYHVYIRFRLECLLIENQLNVHDLPDAWDDMYFNLLGIKPLTPVEGILQDVHWAHGSFGYFPTYSLGSLYAAQFYNAATNLNPEIEAELRTGETAQLMQWLDANIFEKGRMFDSEEICKMATGSGLNPDIFINYLTKKYQTVYQFS